MEKPPQQNIAPNSKQKLVKMLFLVTGTISLSIGAVGIFLPILPTTPFLLLSAACYLRSSNRMHKWLLNNRWFGDYIRNYQEGRGIPFKTKIITLVFLWTTIIYSAFIALDEILIAQIALLLIAFGVSIHLIKLPNFKK
jgi:uncharacterized membrane protein YbaN (DUF454 family)